MTKEEFIGKLQMCYFGDRNAFNEIVGEYDKLKAEYERIYNENCKLREQHNINDISLLDENNRLNNIINELEKWLNEYYKSNRKWYNTELSNHDKQYYGEIYRNTEFMIVKFLKQLKELKNGDNNE